MLPDFPDVRHELDKILQAYFVREVGRRCASFERVPKHRLFEGRSDAISREGQEKDPTKMYEACAEMIFTAKEIAAFDLKSMKAKMDEAAEQMAAQMTKHFYETVSEICEKSGQVTRGGPFTADTVLAALDKIAIDFDTEGGAQMPSIHVAPSQFEAVRAAIEKLHTDPEYAQKREELMQRKFGEWLDREASRALVG